MVSLSAVVITLNEENNIQNCLKSVEFVDEIVVIDSSSTDRTVELARKFTPNIHRVPWKGFAKAKNMGIDRASHDWILSIDADERVSPELKKSILEAINRSRLPAGFYCARRTWYLGRWIRTGGWYPDRTVRLFNRKYARFNEVAVHEKVIIRGDTEQLNGDLLHYSYPTINDHLRKISLYTDLSVDKWIGKDIRINPLTMTGRVLWEFFLKLVIKQSYRDGMPGFFLAGMHSVYIFLKYVKAYEKLHSGTAEPASEDC
ncbi:glycosyltransferase family 2 protein [bacterium]|nr:glycosyltransferase family 2 protein [candidate division CSSED10-310 bacterium]